MKKVWDKAAWFCEAEYLSAKWRASCYQGNWLIIQDPLEIVLTWYANAVANHVRVHNKYWKNFMLKKDHHNHLKAHGKFATMPISMGNEFYVHWDK